MAAFMIDRKRLVQEQTQNTASQVQDLPHENTTSQSVGSFNHSEEHHEHPPTHGLKMAVFSDVEHFLTKKFRFMIR